MLFLLNDAFLEIDPARMPPPLERQQFAALSMDYILQLGRELFAEQPLLHKTDPERARRLCILISLKDPQVNAAQFTSLGSGQPPETVSALLKKLDGTMIKALQVADKDGLLDASSLDQAVWKRLAA